MSPFFFFILREFSPKCSNYKFSYKFCLQALFTNFIYKNFIEILQPSSIIQFFGTGFKLFFIFFFSMIGILCYTFF